MNRIKSYFYFTGEDVDDNLIEISWGEPMTNLCAEFKAKAILRECGGGHIDAWYAETDEFAFDVEV